MFGPLKFMMFTPDQFPDWIDTSAIWACENRHRIWFFDPIQQEYSQTPKGDPERREMVLNRFRYVTRCMKSLAMKRSWEKVNNLIYTDNPSKSQIWLALVILESSHHPASNLMTTAQAEKWKKNTLKQLSDVLESLHLMPDNFLEFHQNYREIEFDRIQSMPYPPETFEAYRTFQYLGIIHPVPVIKNAIKALQLTNFDPGFAGVHTLGSNASRQYFVRSLTGALFFKTGRKHRKLVADVTSAAFDCDISEREIIRLTRTLTHETIHQAIGFINTVTTDEAITNLWQEGKAAELDWNSKVNAAT